MNQEETERSTHTSDHMIQVFAFLIFSSSPHERRYIIPLIIRAITAKTATYWITFQIRSHIKVIGAFAQLTEPPPQPGRSPQSILGAAKTVWYGRSATKNKKKYFFILCI